jgi:tRNA modification GTPase
VGRESAIVTDIEGTTRDILTDTVSLGKTTLRISDTAGLRDTEDRVESIGIERARAEIESAELILAVFDTSRALSEDDAELVKTVSALGCPTIALFNKSDIDAEADLGEIEKSFTHSVRVSALDGTGFSELADIIDALFIDGEIDIKNDAVVADARQHAELVRASEALRAAIAGIEAGVSLDLVCIDVESAMMALGELEGREVGEEIVAEIFSKFCVGK